MYRYVRVQVFRQKNFLESLAVLAFVLAEKVEDLRVFDVIVMVI